MLSVRKWLTRALVVALGAFSFAWLLGQAGVPFLDGVAALPVTFPLLATLAIVAIRLPGWSRVSDGVPFTANEEMLIGAGLWVAAAGGLLAGVSSGFFLEGAFRFNPYVAAGLGLFVLGVIMLALPRGKR